MQIKSLLKARNEKTHLYERFTELLNPEVFQKLLVLKPRIEENISYDIALHNQIEGEHQVLIATNPNCKNCININMYIKELATTIPVSLILLTFPNDKLGERIAQVIISAYITNGWDKAIQLLEEWDERRSIKEIEEYIINEEVLSLWKKQQLYSREQKINQTPSIIIDKHYMPNVFHLSELRYVLT